MSKIFDRSKGDLSGYFSQLEDFVRPLAKYYLKNNEILPSKRYGCTGTGGVPLSSHGRSDSKDFFIAIDDSDAHTLVLGATGSKKSRLIAMPTVKILECAKESMVVVDPKAEIFERTSQSLRKNGYNVFSIDLRNPFLGNPWNPFAIPYALYLKNEKNDIDRAYEFSNDIANNLSKIRSVSAKDPFWENSAASFFFGLIMLLFKYARENNLSAESVNIRNILTLRYELCRGMSVGQNPPPAVRYAMSDAFIYSLLIGTLETAKNTQAGILSTFDQRMRTFSIQPSLLDMLTSDDKCIQKLDQEATAIFLIVPDEKTSYHDLVSLFIKQSYEYLIYSAQNINAENSKSKIRVNFILDEFSSLPTITDFPAMITAARSRNIRFMLFVQSKHQLDLRYQEEAETIRANCDNWIFLVSREVSLLEELSKLSGTRNALGGRMLPVLSFTDLQRLDKEKGEALVISGRHKPIIVNLLDIKYYDDDSFEMPVRKIQPREKYVIDFDFNAYFVSNKESSASFSALEKTPLSFRDLQWPPESDG